MKSPVAFPRPWRRTVPAALRVCHGPQQPGRRLVLVHVAQLDVGAMKVPGCDRPEQQDPKDLPGGRHRHLHLVRRP